LFKLKYESNWDKYFSKLDKNSKEKIWKKIQQLKTIKSARHLKHGLPYFVLESGQYRICYEEEDKLRKIIFAGNHKQYEKWFKKQ